MKKIFAAIMVIMAMATMVACGEKSSVDVRSALSKKVNELESYKVHVDMNVKSGESKVKYGIDVWYKAPDFYRVAMNNEKKDRSQIIVRNKDGVFVLAPAFNKSFKFQSDWPENGGQSYLYQSLAKDVIADKDAKLKTTDKGYVFETNTNYPNNKLLTVQEITFNKKNLTPIKVVIMDKDRNEMIKVNFSKMELNPSFKKGAFDVDKNMTGAQLEIPKEDESEDSGFAAKYPSENIDGVTQVSDDKFQTPSGEHVVFSYEGDDKSYTLIESKTTVADEFTSVPTDGELINLGFTVGALTDHALTWSYDGIDYMLASKNLEQEELIEVATTPYISPEK